MRAFAFLPLATLPLASAHFHLNYPVERGYDEDLMTVYPCGAFNDPSSTRTQWPLTGRIPIQLDLEHTATRIQVLIAVGNEPTGADFKTVLVPTLQEQGPMDFCLGGVAIPSMIAGAEIIKGVNATILVVTNGDPGGGLYNCADVTFVDTTLTDAQYTSHCMNSTNTQVSQNAGTANANGTGSSSSSSSSQTGFATSISTPSVLAIIAVALGCALSL